MRTHGDPSRAARCEQLATALGLNIALAGMLVMTASAFGGLDGRSLWLCWPILSGLMSCLSLRRLSRALAPLFWSCAPPRDAAMEDFRESARKMAPTA